MTDLNTPYPLTPEPQPLRSLLLLVGFILLGGAVGGGLAVLLLGLASAASGTAMPLIEILQAPDKIPNGWWWLMVVQSVSHVCTFLLPALLYWRVIDHRHLSDFCFRPSSRVTGWLLVVLLVIVFMPFNSLLIDWNQHLHLPDTLKPLERWMQDKETQAAELTKFLTSFRTIPQLLLALLVIGLLPAIGEEVLFRGIIQRKFIVWTGNLHVGIWLAAALFSAIHVQFYGFLPRMLLGALFGYLFVWSGNLWVAILAHFVNNGFTVVMLFLYQNKYIPINVEATDSVPLVAALGSLVASVGLAVWFKQSNSLRVNSSPPPQPTDRGGPASTVHSKYE